MKEEKKLKTAVKVKDNDRTGVKNKCPGDYPADRKWSSATEGGGALDKYRGGGQSLSVVILDLDPSDV